MSFEFFSCLSHGSKALSVWGNNSVSWVFIIAVFIVSVSKNPNQKRHLPYLPFVCMHSLMVSVVPIKIGEFGSSLCFKEVLCSKDLNLLKTLFSREFTFRKYTDSLSTPNEDKFVARNAQVPHFFFFSI